MKYEGELEGIKLVNRDFENNIGNYIIKINDEVLRMSVVSGKNLVKDLLDKGFNLNDKCIISGPIKEMSLKEMEEQRRNFAHGNAYLANKSITRENIDEAAERLNN